MKRFGILIVGMLVLSWASMSLAAGMVNTKCQGGKSEAAGKLAGCLSKAEKKLVTLGDPTAYAEMVTKCVQKFERKWLALEESAASSGMPCPTAGDVGVVGDFTHACIDRITEAVGAGVLPGFGQLTSTEQATCFDSLGAEIPCVGTGQDGEVQAGLGRSYLDNGNGTISDVHTGLMWEKLCDDDPPSATCAADHDVDTTYAWDEAFDKIEALNGASFAGFSDWRLPNVQELASLSTYSNKNPAIDAIFNQRCTAPCSLLQCSCTLADGYWTATTYCLAPVNAWNVHFYDGDVSAHEKDGVNGVRAVRGGL